MPTAGAAATIGTAGVSAGDCGIVWRQHKMADPRSAPSARAGSGGPLEAPGVKSSAGTHGTVVTLSVGEVESALQQAGVWKALGRSRTWAGVSDAKQDRNWLAAALGRAAVTKALDGYTPSWVVVHSSEIPGGLVVVKEEDPDGTAVVRVEVAKADPIEDSIFTFVGWVWANERDRGEWRGDWTSPAHIMPRSAQRDLAELRREVRKRRCQQVEETGNE
jgi:hypothetical protein